MANMLAFVCLIDNSEINGVTITSYDNVTWTKLEGKNIVYPAWKVVCCDNPEGRKNNTFLQIVNTKNCFCSKFYNHLLFLSIKTTNFRQTLLKFLFILCLCSWKKHKSNSWCLFHKHLSWQSLLSPAWLTKRNVLEPDQVEVSKLLLPLSTSTGNSRIVVNTSPSKLR